MKGRCAIFTLPFQTRVTAVKAICAAGDNKLRIQLVAPAEDALLQIDTVGIACRQAYKLVKGGKTGTIPVKMPPRWQCHMTLIWDEGGQQNQQKLTHVYPEKLAIVATSKDDEPPKVKMDLVVDYTDEQAVPLLHAFKRDVTVDIAPADGVIPFETKEAGSKPVKKRKANGAQAEAAAPA